MLHQIDCKSKIVSAATNGPYTFVGLATHQVRCFNWKTGRLVRSYEGHTGPVVCILLSQNKRHMYTGSWDKRILCFSIVERNIVENMVFAPGPGLPSHNDFVKCMIFSHDEHYIFSGSADGYVSRWDISRNRQAFEPNTPIQESPYITPVSISVSQRAINSLCLLPLSGDGHILLAAACSDGATLVIDGNTMEVIYRLQPHPTNVLLVRFAGEILWTACADKCIRGFELPFTMFLEKLYSESGKKTELVDLLKNQRETNLYSIELDDWTLDWAFPSDEEIISRTGQIVAGLRSKRLVFLSCRDKLHEVKSSRRFFDGICAVNLVPQVVTQPFGDKELDMVVFASWDHFIRRIAYREDDGLSEELSDMSLSDSELEDKRAQIQEVQDSRLRTMLLPPSNE